MFWTRKFWRPTGVSPAQHLASAPFTKTAKVAGVLSQPSPPDTGTGTDLPCLPSPPQSHQLSQTLEAADLAVKMELQISRTEPDSQPMQEDSLEDFDEIRLKEIIDGGILDFDEWTSLISEIETSFQDDIEKICLVYDSFLSEFPLCYGYWRRYADHLNRLSTVDKVVQVFERAVHSATYSVNVWVDYCSFSILVFEDPNDIRRLFKRAMSFVGKDYLCHTLWDKYIAFEFSQQQWGSLAQVYIQTLKFPSKKLHHYYESFKELAAAWKEEMECLSDSSMDLQLVPLIENEVPRDCTDDEITRIIEDLLDPSIGLDGSKALKKYVSIGKQFYEEACQLDEKIKCFESHIRRPYFHPKPLDVSQLDNWHEYLKFVEMHGDFDWAVKLYERCLIPCANYPEFWMRYVDFMESKGGREISNFALARATQTFLKRLPVIHLFSARYKEQIGNISGAHDAFLQYDAESDSCFVETVIMKANMEKRLGNYAAASGVYKKAIEVSAARENLHDLPMLYVHFSRLQYMLTGNKDTARDILIDGIKCLPHCKLLLEELIKFAMLHGETMNVQVIYSMVNDSISLRPESSQGLNVKDAEDIASLYLQYVDLCGTIDDIKKAWNWYVNLFPNSVRSASYKFSDTGRKPLRIVNRRRQENFVTLPHQSSGDCSSDIPTDLALLDKKAEHPENDDTQPHCPAMGEVSDQKTSSPGKHEILSDQPTFNLLQSGEVQESLQNRVQHVCPEVLEHPQEDTTDANNLSLDVVPEVPKEVEVSKKSSDEEGLELKLEKDLNQNQLSVERLSLDDQDNESLDSSVSTHEREASQEASLLNGRMMKSEPPQETCMSNGSMLEARQNTEGAQFEVCPRGTMKSEPPQETSMSNGGMLEARQNTEGAQFEVSPRGARASDSSEILIGMGSPSSASHQILARKEPLLGQETTPYSCNNRNQRNNVDQFHRESKYGFHGHSHKKLHQRGQVSPQQPYPQAEVACQMPVSQGYPSPTMSLNNSSQLHQGGHAQNVYTAPYGNLAAAQAWLMQNIQQQNFALTYPQAQMPKHLMQNNEQLGQMQSNQAYNQMWQYYYYQQQFLLQQQNQQSPQQQQQLQLQMQMQMQQYYVQPQQQLPTQQAQLQQQQQLFLQQHPYNQPQQHQLQHQQYLQQQQLQQHQQYLQQHMLPQQQQQQQQQQEEEQDEGKPEEQVATL